MMVHDINFNNPDDEGMVVGNVFFPNRYAISLLTHPNMTGYELVFCIQNKDNADVWLAEMDDQLLTITPENNLIGQTEEQVNNYINLVENLLIKY